MSTREHEYACFKRCYDNYNADPKFRALMDESPDTAVRKLGYEGLLDCNILPEAIQYIFFGRKRAGSINNKYISEYVNRISEIADYVSYAVAESRFNERNLCYYGQIVRNRCRMESVDIREHNLIRYFPIAFELTDGCSVQCDFCGFSADKLKGIFAFDEENIALWEGVLRKARALIGTVVGACPCYFATEPLDNPDYEKFMKIFYDVLGEYPQTTTAVCERDPARFRRLTRVLGKENLRRRDSVRISIHSLAQFHKIMEEYSEDELADIELLCNNPESINRISASGRCMTQPEKLQGKNIKYSISCIAGLYVNMVKKSIAFIEPELPDDEFPLGYRNWNVMTFSDPDEFEVCMRTLIDKYGKYSFCQDRNLAWNKNIRILCQDKDYIIFEGKGYRFKVSWGKLMFDIIERVNRHETFLQIVSELGLFGELYKVALGRMQDLYIRGYLRMV